ncbi:MAG: hypothetical protein V2I36_19080 [Desulfopila sp.]|jgi:hypothetical protein|nr:hypothetical protein [Desulfopila sp.]
MSIRVIAQEVYKSQQRVHSLEEQLSQADYKDQDPIKDQLRQAKAELKVLQNMLNNKKNQSSKPQSRFSR